MEHTFLPYKHIIYAGVAAFFSFASINANAVLERHGPINANHGYPEWYQDKTGIATEFCTPLNQAELDGGWCLLLTGDTVAPETFPNQFADEHFYWAGNADATPVNNPAVGRVILVLATEAAFSGATVQFPDQITFNRIRIRVDNPPVTGTYKIIHPFGEESVEATAGTRIFISDDVGIACPIGQFHCALESRIGPYLLPSNTPGGAELAPIAGPVAGKLYIADPARVGPVTGSSLPNFTDSTGASRNHNIFRIEGPAGSNLDGQGNDFVETTDFTLMGRLFQGTVPGRTTIDRASYMRDATAQQIDVYATATPTLASRLPAAPPATATPPQLSFFDAPCTTTIQNPGTLNETIVLSAPTTANEILMEALGTNRWGQAHPAVLPDAVCVKDNSTQPTPTFTQASVNDFVQITDASYNPSTQTLSVTALSGDTLTPPTLSLDGYTVTPITGNGTFTVAAVNAPSANVRVSSTARGSDHRQVSVGLTAGPPVGTAPVANPDTALTDEEVPVTIDVLANDTNAIGGTIVLVQSPTKGIFDIATGLYTPTVNANGTDSFSYRITTPTTTSNIATVSITINPINDAPSAVNDTAGTTINTTISIPVTGNDVDVDGDTLNVASVTPVTGPGAATATANGGAINFVASTAGTYTFGYVASDGITTSNQANVTVTVAGAEQVNVTRAQFRTIGGRWIISGTSSVTTPHNITFAFTGNCSGIIGSTSVSGGIFTFDLRNVTSGDPRNPDRAVDCTAISATTDLGGVDPTTPIQIRL